MKTRNKIIIALACTSVLVGMGSASATYAWYQLNLSRNFTIHGTFLRNSAGLEIGFSSDLDLFSIDNSLSNDLEEYEDTDNSYPGRHLYFLKQSEEEDAIKNDEIESELIKRVLTAEGFASDVIYPLTTGKYTNGTSLHTDENGNYTDEANLMLPPANYSTYDDYHKKAERKYYTHLGLCFRTTAYQNIYLSDYSFSADKSRESLRIYMESVNTYQSAVFTPLAKVFKPAASEEGKTIVGGHLDLDQDGKYEARNQNIGATQDKFEVFYGQLKDGVNLSDVYKKNEDNTSYFKYGETALPKEKPNYNCFSATGHDFGTIPLADNYEEYAASADYDTLLTYLVRLDQEDIRASNFPGVTRTDEHGIGFLDIDMFLEGWDKSNINQVIGDMIGASFSFTIL